jgi:hypothetical protein
MLGYVRIACSGLMKANLLQVVDRPDACEDLKQLATSLQISSCLKTLIQLEEVSCIVVSLLHLKGLFFWLLQFCNKQNTAIKLV